MPLMLGKKPAKHDARNLLVKDIIKEVALPSSYNFDTKHKGIPTPMYGNDVHGDCVIAGRAHQTLRFEVLEQKKILPITEAEVIREWKKENGNTEDGLYVLDSLKLWRKNGWIAGGKKYKIKAFAQNNPANSTEIKTTIYNNVGIGLGLSLPDTWVDEFDAGKPWKDTSESPNPYNGHYVFVCGYTKTYLTCVTWGKKQKMTWNFFREYTDEAYACIDALNAKKFDEVKINAFLETVTPVYAGHLTILFYTLTPCSQHG